MFTASSDHYILSSCPSVCLYVRVSVRPKNFKIKRKSLPSGSLMTPVLSLLVTKYL